MSRSLVCSHLEKSDRSTQPCMALVSTATLSCLLLVEWHEPTYPEALRRLGTDGHPGENTRVPHTVLALLNKLLFKCGEANNCPGIYKGNRPSLVFAWDSSAGTVVTPSGGRRGCSGPHSAHRWACDCDKYWSQNIEWSCTCFTRKINQMCIM